MSKAPATTVPSLLSRLRSYRKLVRPKLTAVVLTDGYHVQAEVCRALKALGHVAVPFSTRPDAGDESLQQRGRRLLHRVAEVRPDLLISINYVGFDRAGWLSQVVEKIALPVAVWFVDSPLFFAMGYLAPSPQITSFFAWDQSHVAALKSYGAPRVHYLPLGCELETFAPDAASQKPPGALPMAFVGSSLVPLQATWRARLMGDEVAGAEAMATRLLQSRQALHGLVPDPLAPIDRRVLMAAYANCAASRTLRRQRLLRLPQTALHVFGDAAWRHELPEANVHGTVAYGGELGRLYRLAAININATILQMPSGVNQRVFDVPAANGFVLSDAQQDLYDLFDVDAGEAVVYRDNDELAALAARYGKDAAARRQVTRKARARIEAHHRYTHRVTALLAQMRRAHGRLVAGSYPSAAP